MATYEVTLKDRTVEVIEGVDAYQQEGQMTTFFSTGEGRQVVDCWSTRLASFRTSEVVIIRRVMRPRPSFDLPTDLDTDADLRADLAELAAGLVPVRGAARPLEVAAHDDVDREPVGQLRSA